MLEESVEYNESIVCSANGIEGESDESLVDSVGTDLIQ